MISNMKATELLRSRVALSEDAFADRERPYTFETPEKLIADFQADIARWNRENRHS
jgi:hypothetical protein